MKRASKIYPSPIRSSVVQRVRIELAIDDVSAVPKEWTQIQLCDNRRGKTLKDLVFDCSEGRVISSGKDQLVFHSWLEKKRKSDDRFLSKV